MKKIFILPLWLYLSLCGIIQGMQEKKVVIIRAVYSDSYSEQNELQKPGIYIIASSDNIKKLLKKHPHVQDISISRLEVIDIEQKSLENNLSNIDDLEESKIPSYTIKELKDFYINKYKTESSDTRKLPLEWFFESDSWKKEEVWLFNNKKNRWEKISFEKYNRKKTKWKLLWRFLTLLLVILAIGLYIMTRRSSKKSKKR